MEGVLAAFAQFDNDVRSDRTRAGMKAALEIGRWVFLAPIGYLNAPRSMGKSLIPRTGAAGATCVGGVRDGPIHEGTTAETGQGVGPHESARQAAHVASHRNVAAQPAVRRHRGRARVRRTQHPGDFEPLISEELFYQVQAVLSGRLPSTAPRQRSHPTFRCAASFAVNCGRGLTAAGRRAATSTTPTTTAALAAVP